MRRIRLSQSSERVHIRNGLQRNRKERNIPDSWRFLPDWIIDHKLKRCLACTLRLYYSKACMECDN